MSKELLDAVKSGDVSKVSSLLPGADVNMRDAEGDTLLMVAANTGNLAMVKALLAAGADINATNEVGWTPLMMTRGVFMANSKKEFPVAREILSKAMTSKGVQVE